jgi:hypothetical protein
MVLKPLTSNHLNLYSYIRLGPHGLYKSESLTAGISRAQIASVACGCWAHPCPG